MPEGSSGLSFAEWPRLRLLLHVAAGIGGAGRGVQSIGTRLAAPQPKAL